MTDDSTKPDWWRRARACIRPKGAAEIVDLLSLCPDDSPVYRDLGNGLLILYHVAEGPQPGYVCNRYLDAHGISERKLHEVAMENLHDLATERLRVQHYGSLHAVLMKGHCEASAILLDCVWDRWLANDVRGDFVVAIPSRDVLAYGDSNSPQAIEEMHTVVRRVFETGADHLISDQLFRRQGGRWVTYEDPADRHNELAASAESSMNRPE